MNELVGSKEAEMTSRRQACALSAAAAASLNNVTSSLCDVNITSSSADENQQWLIPFVACHSPPFSAGKPSLIGHS